MFRRINSSVGALLTKGRYWERELQMEKLGQMKKNRGDKEERVEEKELGQERKEGRFLPIVYVMFEVPQKRLF